MQMYKQQKPKSVNTMQVFIPKILIWIRMKYYWLAQYNWRNYPTVYSNTRRTLKQKQWHFYKDIYMYI